MSGSTAPTLAVYLTPHGNGHTVRMCDIVRALRRRHPAVEVVLVSRHPPEFLHSRIGDPTIRIRQDALDTGMIQRDSVRSDPHASLTAALELLARWPALVEREARWLADETIRAVVCDIPAIPIEAARRLGRPALAVGNFSWNWIYEHAARDEPRWRPVADAFRRAYAGADQLIRLPFHEPMDAFPQRCDVGLVASPGRPRREDIAAATGAPPDAVWALLSFSSLDWTASALQRAAATPGVEWFTVRPLAWTAPHFHALDRRRFPFADVLASCDVVVSKTGFGIVSECIVNDKPIVYVHRPEWPESYLLVEGIRECARGVELAAEDLYAGELARAIEQALQQPPPARTLPTDGADRAADLIAAALG
ncbi:MAG: hypothetical protein N2652_08975 [Kiritimatiellae bacterium]|nr:hypothetical protein [Kiritimatiellia bacterium]